jgi:NADH dehydrogenase
MKTMVAGGTGLLGREITRALLDAGHEVSVMARRRPGADSLDARATWASGDVTDPASLADPLRGIQVVVDAVQFHNSPIEDPKKGNTFERIDLGGTKNLADAAKAAGVGHFVGISGASAAADAKYRWLRYKWQEEQHIKASGLRYTIFRPSWIYGPGDVSLNRFWASPGSCRSSPSSATEDPDQSTVRRRHGQACGGVRRPRGAVTRTFEIGGRRCSPWMRS